MPLGWKAQEILYRIAGDKAPMLALTDAEEAKRVKVADAWTDWWRDSAATTDLAKINLDEAMQGVNVICQEGSGTTPPRVWACRADGKPLWEIKNVMAWDASCCRTAAFSSPSTVSARSRNATSRARSCGR